MPAWLSIQPVGRPSAVLMAAPGCTHSGRRVAVAVSQTVVARGCNAEGALSGAPLLEDMTVGTAPAVVGDWPAAVMASASSPTLRKFRPTHSSMTGGVTPQS